MPDGNDSDNESGAAVAAFLWSLFIFKMATVVLIFYHLRTFETGLLLGVTTWYWFPAMGVLVAAPIAYQIRLRKARKRREELLRSEWMVGAPEPCDDPAAVRER